MEEARDEPMTVGVDQVAGHVLAQGHWQGTPDLPVTLTHPVTRRLVEAHHCARIQAIARKESFSGEDRVAVCIVVALSLASRAFLDTLQPFHEAIASRSESILLGIESALALP